MTLKLTPIDHGDLCVGWQWAVDDIQVLAEQVARVALGQYRHVSQVLEGLNVVPPTGKKAHAIDALKKLHVSANGDPWQRDGWLFQILSWIAASQKKKDSVLRPPHIFHAHKGFDGLQLEFSDDGKSVTAIVIFEDKATDDPRTTIRDDVWPGIVKMEAGERISELTHEATALLEAQAKVSPEMNVDEAIDNIFWQEARHYRVSITTGATHGDETSRARLFKDYDASAAGAVKRRRAETMHFDDLRPWMKDFAQLVSEKIKEIADV